MYETILRHIIEDVNSLEQTRDEFYAENIRKAVYDMPNTIDDLIDAANRAGYVRAYAEIQETVTNKVMQNHCENWVRMGIVIPKIQESIVA